MNQKMITNSTLDFTHFCTLTVFTSLILQFADRLRLMLMPPRNQPDVIYLRQIPTFVVHFFTLVQLICLCFLCSIRLTYASIISPLAVSKYCFPMLCRFIHEKIANFRMKYLPEVSLSRNTSKFYMVFVADDSVTYPSIYWLAVPIMHI